MKKITIAIFIIFIYATANAEDFNLKTSSNNENNGYTSSTGTQYKYDLNDPGDKVEYDTDVEAKLNDSVMMPVTPSVEIDKGLGESGGGLLDD